MYKNSICFISFFFLFFFSLMNFFFMIYFIMNNLVYFLEWEVICLNSTNIIMSVLLDWMSLLFMMFVSLISSVVIYYSKSYMNSELNLNRFIYLVLLFVFSMILLIISPNLISIFLGWDGLGLVSYCLVIYYQNIKSFNAGMLTALSNRVGDVCILMVISWILNYGSWNYIFYLEFMKNDLSMYIVSGLIIMAAMTKSAQIPYSSWLPAAMAAPTPVSALVHSSTLVTAGVYLLIRFNLLLLNMFFIKVLLLLAGLTMFMAGISANYEFDLKKIIALSTLSQLGLMMSILSMGFPDLAFFHLLTHAMFKALLFMCAGVIIHMMSDIQDIRFMGGISFYIPLTSLCLNISNLALCGIPFLAGFYSKDMILELVSLSNLNFYIFFLYYFSTGLTMYYTIRLLMYLMMGDFNLMSVYNLYDEDYIMLKSMFTLMMMSIFSGSLLSWLIFSYPYMVYLPFNLKMMVIYVSILGGAMGYMVSVMSLYSVNKFLLVYNISNFLCMMWFMPNLSNLQNYYFIKLFFEIMKLFLSTLLMLFSLFMFLLNHPLSMGLMILLQTLLTCLLSGMMIKTYWFSYILFLIFMGGLLVLFIYVSSIASNELFILPLMMKLMLMFFFFFSIIISFLMFDNFKWMNLSTNLEMINYFNSFLFFNNENKFNLIKLYNNQTFLLMMILIIYLFITLVAIVKITNIFFGPLRPSN